MMERYYTTDALVRMQLKTENVTSDTANILDKIVTASARIDAYFCDALWFEPQRGVWDIDATVFDIGYDTRTVYLNPPFLAVEAVTDFGVVNAGDYTALPTLSSPYTALELSGAAYTRWQNGYSAADMRRAVQVSGVTGYHADYGRAWIPVNALTADVDDETTTLTVAATTAYSRGMLLRIGDEFMRLLDVPTATTLSVERGVNGTTASEHLTSADVSYWKPDKLVERAATLTAAFLVHRRGSFELQRFDTGTDQSVQYPDDLPPEAVNILSQLRKRLPRLWR